MKRQNEMVESFMTSGHDFTDNLERSINLLEREIDEAAEMGDICTDEWCLATEHNLDELANMLYSISEPRWASDNSSRKISASRDRMHNLYSKFRSIPRLATA